VRFLGRTLGVGAEEDAAIGPFLQGAILGVQLEVLVHFRRAEPPGPAVVEDHAVPDGEAVGMLGRPAFERLAVEETDETQVVGGGRAGQRDRHADHESPKAVRHESISPLLRSDLICSPAERLARDRSRRE
jgi:hypothetical protein